MKRLLNLYILFQLLITCYSGRYHPTIEYIFPLPESDLLSRRATIFLRLHDPYKEQITNLDSFISVTEDGQQCTGETFFSTDNRTIIFKPDHLFNYGATTTVTIKTGQFYPTDFSYNFTVVLKDINKIEKTGKLSGSMKSNTILNGSSQVRIINGISVPSDFPIIETIQTGETAPGYIFYGSNFRETGYGNYLIICKNDGTPYFYKRFDIPGNNANFVYQPYGVCTAYFHYLGRNIIFDSNFFGIDTVKPGHGYYGDDHEFIVLNNGHILLTCEQHIIIDMSQIVDGGQTEATVQGNMFQELDSHKNVIFEWRSWDHFQFTDAEYINLTNSLIDYVHMNSIAIDYDNNYIISSRHLSEVTKIDRKTGEIIWRFGGVNNQFEFVTEDMEFSYQHSVKTVPDKPGNYIMFDNGNKRNPGYARAVEYKLDTITMTSEKVWEYRYNPDRYTYMMGSVQILPNNNRFIDWSTTAETKSCEVTYEGDKVFDIYSNGASTYRANRYEWNSIMNAPYLIIENFGNIINLIFNKFGDQNVAYYNIYHGKNSAVLSYLDSTKNTYYQTAYLENNTKHYFAVTAIDSGGFESDFSDTINTNVEYQPPGNSLIKNGNFESYDFWELEKLGQADASGDINHDPGYTINILNPGLTISDIQLKQGELILVKNKKYTLEFNAFSENSRFIEIKVEGINTPHIDLAKIGMVYLTNQTEHFSFDFTMDNNTETDAELSFRCGQFDANVTIDSVLLKEDIELFINDESSDATPALFSLHTNYPNPFNSKTNIKYSIPEPGFVSIKVYDILGKEVRTLVDQYQSRGKYSVRFNAKDLSSGIYFYQLQIRDPSGCLKTGHGEQRLLKEKKMILIR